MEDPRLSGIHSATARKWFSSLYHTIWRQKLMRSGMLTVLLLVAALLGMVIAYRAHMRGSFHQLKLRANITDERPDAVIARPGGQDPATLMRTRLAGDSTPEFLSATILPGRGMNVLQISAYIPGKGEVNLMASPSVDDAADAMTGEGADAHGQASLTMGGAFEAPWAGPIWGTPVPGTRHVTTLWRGHAITLPGSDGGEATVARGGLMLAQGADTTGTNGLLDGGQAEGVFHAGDYGVHWPSKTDVTVTVLLRSQVVDLTVLARNTGDQAEPIGIGWQPRFTVFGGNRGEMRLHVPGLMRVEVRDKGKTQPTGKLIPVAGTPYDFTQMGGVKLGTMDLDDCFVELHQRLLDNGPAAELTDRASGYGLRVTALTSTIKAMHVAAPAKGGYVSISPQYNYPDPLGREWKDADTGMVVLQPGQSTEWKVRLELFRLDTSVPPM